MYIKQTGACSGMNANYISVFKPTQKQQYSIKW